VARIVSLLSMIGEEEEREGTDREETYVFQLEDDEIARLVKHDDGRGEVAEFADARKERSNVSIRNTTSLFLSSRTHSLPPPLPTTRIGER
jgi:hypothetical protein